MCDNRDRYGYGSSVCGRCNRCHGCGSTNNGIGPIQSVYFGGKWVVRKIGEAVAGGGGGAKDKDGRTPLKWAARNGHQAVVRLLQPLSTTLPHF